MNRQEPVIDSRFLKCRTLKDRVDLPWETVENLTKQTQTPIPTQVHVQSQPVAEIEPQPFEPQPLILTEAEKKALIARLAPAVEAALRENLKNTVEMAAENAVTSINHSAGRRRRSPKTRPLRHHQALNHFQMQKPVDSRQQLFVRKWRNALNLRRGRSSDLPLLLIFPCALLV